MKQLKTREDILAEFNHHGIAISEWARANNLPRQVVQDVLNVRNKGSRGMGHKVAVLLGIKDGVIIEGQA